MTVVIGSSAPLALPFHVFRVAGGLRKSAGLDEYLEEQFDRAAANPEDDFCSVLTKAEFRGRPLTREEMMGFANIAFAGGRDTIIHTISCALGHLAAHPEALEFLREDKKRIIHASEEFFRVFMPLTHIGGYVRRRRKCSEFPLKLAGGSRSAGRPPISISRRLVDQRKCASTGNRIRTFPSGSARTCAWALRTRV